jgi:hypothetical protein
MASLSPILGLFVPPIEIKILGELFVGPDIGMRLCVLKQLTVSENQILDGNRDLLISLENGLIEKKLGSLQKRTAKLKEKLAAMVFSTVKIYINMQPKSREEFMQNEVNQRLRTLLYRAGICSECEQELFHWVDEPFSSCDCFQGAEDSSGPSTIQKLRMENKELREYKQEIEDSFKFIMDERPNDEVHCSCVPFLKIKIKELEERNNSNIQILRNEIKGWENKWKIAVEMAAIAENKLADIKNACNY